MSEKKAKKTAIERYQRSLRSAVRGLWSGVIDTDQFRQSMNLAVETGLTSAWHEGAQQCGITPDELTARELNALDERIIEERDHIADFGEVIQEGSRANGGQLSPLFERLNLWINRYLDVTNEAKVMACGNQKLVWVLGPTERHCRTCPRLDGKVKRASVWEARGLRPQNPPNPLLECGGWNCLCDLVPTDRPASRGSLPGVP